jgi:uncharacterized membrane protein
MKRENLLFILAAVGVTAVTVYAIVLFLGRERPVEEAFSVGYASGTVRAEVLEIVEEGVTTMGEIEQPYLILRVRILDGLYTGMEAEIDYGQRQVRPGEFMPSAGETILVTAGAGLDGRMTVYFSDYLRTEPLLVLFGAFVLASIGISGWKGVRSLVGLAASLGVILGYILPQILAGRDPVLVSISGAFFLLAFTLYITYGWTLKTHSAVLGTLTALALTGFLASYFTDLARLSGFGSEHALFLNQLSGGQVNMHGLLLGGMLIGALGVLDDLVITQSSVVFELQHAARDGGEALPFWDLFRRGMRVGRDHVAATVNTLVLAYTGASLPMLLLFSMSSGDFGNLINLEYVTEEIVRTLVGTLGLIAAVPLSTGLAAWLALNQERAPAWLGPAGEGHAH